MSVLDDLKMIHDRDKQDALGVAEKQWQQLLVKFNLPKIEGDFRNVVYAGMGGSALGAELAFTWPGFSVPFEISKSYNIPNYVDENTLFITASYSGNTEETLSALKEAEAKNAKIVVISNGGKLSEIALANGYPLARLPDITQPRYATLSVLKALVEVLVASGLEDSSKINQLEQAGDNLEGILKTWRADVPTDANATKKLALELAGSSVVVYSSALLKGVAYMWKIGVNENAKNVAWFGTFPEFSHNEFLGWSSHPENKPYKVINIVSSFDHEQIKKRFNITDRMLSGKKPNAETVELQGQDILSQMLYGVSFGVFTSLYLALLNGLDPSPVDLIEKFKKELV